MDEGDRSIRNTTYRLFVELGRAPTADEVAAAERLATKSIEEAWWRLHEDHALVLDPSGRLHMANPFSAIATPYRVNAAGRWWHANCAWDAVGICAALHDDGDIEASCPDCGQRLTVAIRGKRPSNETLLFHCLVPAGSWWDDIGFT